MKVADPGVIERDAREILAAQYGLQSPELRPIQGTGGAIKSIYRVRAGEREYLLKRYRPDYRSLRDVTEISGAQVFLAKGALPVAPVIPNREGLLASVGACGSWVLYAYIVGRQYREGEIPTRAAAALGEAVARQVIRLAGWQTDWEGAERLDLFWADERIRLYQELLRHARQGRSRYDQQAVQELRGRIAALGAMAAVAAPLMAMPRQWVHGDMNEGNIIFDPDQDRVRAVIDFDNLRWAPRGFDFMRGLLCFGSQGPQREAYARAYMRLVQPTEGEVELCVPLWTYSQLCDIWPLEQRYLQPEGPPPGDPLELPLDWWQRPGDQTTEWLLQVAAEAAQG